MCVHVSVYVYKRPCPSTHPAFLFASTPTRHRQFLFSPLTDQCSQSEHCRLTLLCQSSWVAYTAGVTTDTACFIVAGEKEKKKVSQSVVFHHGFHYQEPVANNIYFLRKLTKKKSNIFAKSYVFVLILIVALS